MVMPRFVGQALRNQPITIFGDGTQTRCFCHVSDVVGGLVSLAAHPEAIGKVFNLGGPEEISICDLAKRIIELTGSKSQLEFVPYDVAYETGFEDMVRRVPDTDRARRLVGFETSIDLDDMIRSVITEYRV
jgi:UDP-glucose 4-epimerase